MHSKLQYQSTNEAFEVAFEIGEVVGFIDRETGLEPNEGALDNRAFLVRAGAPPGRPGLHPLSRPAAQQPIAAPRSSTRYRTAVGSSTNTRSQPNLSGVGRQTSAGRRI
jgi:hypothetical protein